MQPYPNVVPDLVLHLCGSAPGCAIPGQAGITSIVCTPQPFSEQRHAVHLLNNPDRLWLHQQHKSNHRCDNLSYFTLMHRWSSAINRVAAFLPHNQQSGPLQPPHLSTCMKMSLCIEGPAAKPNHLAASHEVLWQESCSWCATGINTGSGIYGTGSMEVWSKKTNVWNYLEFLTGSTAPSRDMKEEEDFTGFISARAEDLLTLGSFSGVINWVHYFFTDCLSGFIRKDFMVQSTLFSPAPLPTTWITSLGYSLCL